MFVELLFQTLQPFCVFVDRADIFLKNNLLGRGREVLSWDGTYAHHERGLQMWGVQKAWDHVEHRLAPSQTVVTAVSAKRVRLDGSEVRVQQPERSAEEMASWQETVRES